MGMIGAMMMESPRMNAESIAASIDCSRGDTRLALVVEREEELGIEIEELVAQSREEIVCVLQIELIPGIELTGRRDAYDGRRFPRGGCLCISCGSSPRREMAVRLDDSCQYASCSQREVMREGSWSSRSRSRIAFV
jgi:hypothetical protein